MTPRTGWTPEKTLQMVTMWKDGKSAQEIHKAIGAPSRSAVIGKLSRMGLQRRLPKPPNKVRVKVERPIRFEPEKQRAPFSNLRERHPVPICEPGPDGGVTIMDLRPFHAEITSCRWPIGGSGSEMKYCGADCAAPYCVEHAKKAFSPRTVAQKKTANRGVMWAAGR